MMPAMTTAILALVALAVVVFAVGVERSKRAVTTAGSKTKRVATSTTGAAVGGIGIGAQLGYEIVQAGVMEPFAVATVLAGVAGYLGIEGMLGGITGLQFLLIGVTLFALVVIFGGDR